MIARFVDNEGVTWHEMEISDPPAPWVKTAHSPRLSTLLASEPDELLTPSITRWVRSYVLAPEDGGPLAIYRPESDLHA